MLYTDCFLLKQNMRRKSYNLVAIIAKIQKNHVVQTDQYSSYTSDGDIAMCQQHFKKTRIQQTVKEGQTGIVEHETMMASKEGNKLVYFVNNNQILIDIISEGIVSNWFILFTFY